MEPRLMANLSYSTTSRTTCSPWRSYNASLVNGERLPTTIILRGVSIQVPEEETKIIVNDAKLELRSELRRESKYPDVEL